MAQYIKVRACCRRGGSFYGGWEAKTKEEKEPGSQYPLQGCDPPKSPDFLAVDPISSRFHPLPIASWTEKQVFNVDLRETFRIQATVVTVGQKDKKFTQSL